MLLKLPHKIPTGVLCKLLNLLTTVYKIWLTVCDTCSRNPVFDIKQSWLYYGPILLKFGIAQILLVKGFHNECMKFFPML
jgi:hypothetical protein